MDQIVEQDNNSPLAMSAQEINWSQHGQFVDTNMMMMQSSPEYPYANLTNMKGMNLFCGIRKSSLNPNDYDNNRDLVMNHLQDQS